MKKKGLAPYLILSLFAHACFFVGVYAFFKLPGDVTLDELIPVETIVLKEEPPAPQPEPIISKEISETTSLMAKSRFSMHTEIDRRLEELAAPIPRESNFEPTLNVENVSALAPVLEDREAQSAKSSPMISAPKMPALDIPSAPYSPPDESFIQEIETPKALVEAEARSVSDYSQAIAKIEAPLERSPSVAAVVSELQPVQTVEAPSIHQPRKMTLASSRDLPLERDVKREPEKVLQSIVRPDLRAAIKKESIAIPELEPPESEPAVPHLNLLSSFPFPGSEEGGAYLFVVDTSGTVKGAPMEGIKKSALEFIKLMGRNDRVGIMTFNDKTELLSPFTSEKGRLRKTIDKLRTAGKQTVLYDALLEADGMIEKENRKNKFIVLFSDGKDEGSRASLDSVIKKTRGLDVCVLSVGYSRVEKNYLDIMKVLAEKTGGLFVYAPQFRDILSMYRASRDVGAEEPGVEKIGLSSLQVISKPLGARVFVDGGFKGETPLELELPFGQYQVRLILPPKYHKWEALVEISTEGRIPLHVGLLPVQEKSR